jgi:membrane protein DedA with SNARE-associated domain
MASLGSALGSIPLYIIGYLGGEKVLRKRISEERFHADSSLVRAA